ncbi:DNA mismatch repair protein MSH1, mitochondrial [Glycine max]|nr:DNA mismatch repair protein MSH1, mitochondrial [Glycine max]
MGSRKPRGPKDLLNMKIVKKSRSKQPIRVVRRRIQSEEYAASEIQRQTHHRGSNKKSNESYKSTESMEEIVIPGDIPELDSLVVYEKELCSDFFSNGTGCLEPSGERRKKNGHKSCNKDESHDLNKSITDFVIPGDVPAIDSLMRLQMCRKLSTVQLTERLGYSNLSGLNSNMKNGRDGIIVRKLMEESIFMKEHLTGKCCNSSQNFHVKVLLCRVGEFYEAWGINVCILVEYEGLNPFGGLQSDSIMRAGCWYFYFCRQTFILMLPFVLGTCVFIVKMRWKI